MSSKFWVCIALISVAVAHTYIYTDLMKNSEPEMGVNLLNFLGRIGSEWKSLLMSAKSLSQSARHSISSFRQQTTQWRLERAKRMKRDSV